MADDSNENDLPLVSNASDILINHYMFEFACNFEEKFFTCCVVLYLEPVIDSTKREVNCCKCKLIENYDDNDSSLCLVENQHEEKSFMLVLDCHKIVVESVEEINVDHAQEEKFKYVEYNPVFFAAARKLNFSTDKWSLKIWKIRPSCKFCFPKAIRISYKTVSEGPSLLWVTDQSKK